MTRRMRSRNAWDEQLDVVADDAWRTLAERGNVDHVVDLGESPPARFSGSRRVLLRDGARFWLGWMDWESLRRPPSRIARVEGSVVDQGGTCRVRMQLAGFWDPLTRQESILAREPWLVLVIAFDPAGWAMLGWAYAAVAIAVLLIAGGGHFALAVKACARGRARVRDGLWRPVTAGLYGQRALPARGYR